MLRLPHPLPLFINQSNMKHEATTHLMSSRRLIDPQATRCFGSGQPPCVQSIPLPGILYGVPPPKFPPRHTHVQTTEE